MFFDFESVYEQEEEEYYNPDEFRSYSSDDSDEVAEQFEFRPKFRKRYPAEELENTRIQLANKYKLASLETLCIRVAANYAYKYQQNPPPKKTRKLPSSFALTQHLFPCVATGGNTDGNRWKKMQIFKKVYKKQLLRNSNKGPFEKLPPTILAKIYDEFVRIALINDIHNDNTPEIFITKQAQNASVQRIHLDNNRETLLAIKSKCQEKLRKLSLTECCFKGVELHNTLILLKNLVELNFTDSNITDETLGFIVTNMKLISELDLTNTKITENGLQHLMKTKLENLKILKLNNLEIQASSLMEILKFYPDLEELENERTCDSLELWRKAFSDRTTKLKSLLFIISATKTADSYRSIMKYCPDLTSISVQFKGLRRFRTNVISPWFGSKLVTTVKLHSITINITDLLLACPNINLLCLIRCKLQFTRSSYNIDIIKNIKHFSIYRCRYGPCFQVIADIFYSKNLEVCKIFDCYFASKLIYVTNSPMYFNHFMTDESLDNDWMQEIIKRNKNLQCINFVYFPFSCEEINRYLELLLQGKVRLFNPNPFHFLNY